MARVSCGDCLLEWQASSRFSRPSILRGMGGGENGEAEIIRELKEEFASKTVMS